jgi:hypothetical protein
VEVSGTLKCAAIQQPSPRPRHRDADAQPARPWRSCAGAIASA